jgi:hypothetical protein
MLIQAKTAVSAAKREHKTIFFTEKDVEIPSFLKDFPA